MEDYTTHNFLECHQDVDHTILSNIRRSFSVIYHTLLVVSVFWRLQIQLDVASDSTNGKSRCMCKVVKKTKDIRRYMEALALQTGAPTVHWEDNTSFIFVVEYITVTPIVKHIYIPVCFLQE